MQFSAQNTKYTAWKRSRIDARRQQWNHFLTRPRLVRFVFNCWKLKDSFASLSLVLLMMNFHFFSLFFLFHRWRLIRELSSSKKSAHKLLRNVGEEESFRFDCVKIFFLHLKSIARFSPSRHLNIDFMIFQFSFDFLLVMFHRIEQTWWALSGTRNFSVVQQKILVAKLFLKIDFSHSITIFNFLGGVKRFWTMSTTNDWEWLNQLNYSLSLFARYISQFDLNDQFLVLFSFDITSTKFQVEILNNFSLINSTEFVSVVLYKLLKNSKSLLLVYLHKIHFTNTHTY